MLCQVETAAEPSPIFSDEVRDAWGLEQDAAQLSRGLAASRSWKEIEEQARSLVRAAATWPAPLRSAWSDDEADATWANALQSASRALDGAAMRSGLSGDAAREAGLWAALGFALGGNFPSASVVLKRTFPRLKARAGSPLFGSSRAWPDGVPALIAALSPALAPSVASFSPLAERLNRRGLNGQDEELFALLEEELGGSWLEFLEPARAALEGACALSTLAALDEDGGALSEHTWSETLAARVPLLLPPQKVALARGFLSRSDNALAALPPGTGKTWLGELFLLEGLARAEASGTLPLQAPLGVFLVPYVALGRGVVAALCAHTRDLGIEVRAWLGGEGDEAPLPEGAGIIVATPERFDGAWRLDPQLSERLCGVVVDEAHLVADGTRGARLETLVARFGLANVRTLFLSAATDETHLGDWIGAPRALQLHLDWTPTARRLAFWRQDGAIEWWGELAGQGTQLLGEAPLEWPRRDLRGGDSFVGAQKQEGALWANVAFGARHCFEEHGGAVLCLCATRRGARALAQALARVFPECFEPSGARAQAIALIETRYRTLLPLARLLRHGVAWHSAALPSEVRALIERAVGEGEIVALAATRTLAEGVDLPFNQTLLADWLAWDEQGWKPLGVGLFRNIAGRCGRAGAFTEGDTWVFDNPLGPSQFCAPDVRWGVQRAQFLNVNAGGALSALEAETVSGATRAAWESGLTALLAWHGATRGPLDADELARVFGAESRDARKWNSALQSAFDAWLAGDWARLEADGRWTITARGQALSQCDLSGATAGRLLDALASLPRRAPRSSEDAAKINAQLWHALEGVPEAEGAAQLWSSRSKFVVRAGDLVAVARDWLEGQSPAKTFAELPRVREAKNFPGEAPLRAWLDGEDASGQRMDFADASWSASYDRFGDWTRAALGTWTPRLWRACGALAPLVASRPDLKTWEWNRFAARFAVGVSTDWAVGALRLNAPGGRETAAIFGRHWPFPVANNDALGLAPLARDDEGARKRAEEAFGEALREAGGPYCAQGLCVRALKDWLWARAGATK